MRRDSGRLAKRSFRRMPPHPERSFGETVHLQNLAVPGAYSWSGASGSRWSGVLEECTLRDGAFRAHVGRILDKLPTYPQSRRIYAIPHTVVRPDTKCAATPVVWRNGARMAPHAGSVWRNGAFGEFGRSGGIFVMRRLRSSVERCVGRMHPTGWCIPSPRRAHSR